MIRLYQGLVDRATAGEGAWPLALFRMLVALATAVAVGSMVRAGLVDVLLIDRDWGGMTHFSHLPWQIELLGGAKPVVMRSLVAACLIGCVFMFLGLGGRLTALWVGQTFMPIADVHPHAGGSYDELIQNALWLCVLAPTTAIGSADAWVWRGSPWVGRPVPAWARAIVVFQIVLVYWSTGIQKVSAYWVPGGDLSALYYILQQPTWQRFDLRALAWVYPLTQIGTAVSWWWEVLTPLWLLALWYRATRERAGWVRAWFNAWDVRIGFVLLGVLFHGALTLMLDVGPFPLISLAFYPCFWNHAEWVAIARPLWNWRGVR
jgi:hypothetical protein